MGNSNFVHLHVHTEYSLLDGAIRLDDLFRLAKEYELPAVAVTDHGNMFAAIEFYQSAIKNGIKPIIGCEVYVAPGSRFDKTPRANEESAFHLVLLAKNREGYGNLCRLLTAAYMEGFYYRPRVDKDLLAQYGGGLIALSSCLHGEVTHTFLHKGLEPASEKAAAYAKIFPGRFYLELQENGIGQQTLANDGLKEIAFRLSLPLVATNDCHYLRKEDARVHDILLCIQTGKTVDDPNRMRFMTDQLYFRSPSEMKTLFSAVPEALSNTVEIANACNLELELGKYHFPLYPVPDGETLDSRLMQAAREGLNKRLKDEIKLIEGGATEKEYRDRLEYELNVILQMGFSGYFLIVSDFINFAKKKGIPVGPGRGSAAGSLVAYALRITDVDPLPYHLLFERFLNLERRSMPDIDVDFSKDRREEVLEYISKKYGGKDYAAQIITFGKMQARAVIRDVGRAMNLPYSEVDRIAKLIPSQLKIRLDEAVEKEPRLRELAENDPRIKELLTVSRALEGLPRHASTHAAGVVISDRPIVEYLPLYRGPKEEILTQYAMKAVDKIGLVKFDLLGLKNLTIINHTLQIIKKEHGLDLDLPKIPLDDELTYQLLSNSDTTGVFQLESSGMKDLLSRMKPQTFTDLIASVALYRPGPLESGMVDDFVKGKHGLIQVNYPVAQLEEILKETYGVIVYQEQVMQIASRLADYSMGDADILRAAMGKKNPEVMAAQREKFVEGAVKNRVPRKKAERLFDLMEKFGGYGFNKSHSTAYALIAYQTAYLKAHYPVLFMAALLTGDMESTDNVVKYIAECREKKIEILPPDINESERNFTVKKDKIRFGLAAVKNVGAGAIESIIAARKSGSAFNSLEDFCCRVDLRKVNRRVIESLIKCGAFDSTGACRSQSLAILDEAIDLGQRLQRQAESRQISMFAGRKNARETLIKLPAMPEWPRDQLLSQEKEALGFYITGHPLTSYISVARNLGVVETVRIPDLPEGRELTCIGIKRALKEINTRKGERMAFLNLEDLKGIIEVIVFSDVYRQCRDALNSDDPLLIKGTVSKDELSTKVIASEIVKLNRALERNIASLDVRITAQNGISPEKISEFRDILAKYKGSCPVSLHIRIPQKGRITITLPSSFSVVPSPDLLSQIQICFGKGSVQVPEG